jgi:hypothetical protein
MLARCRGGFLLLCLPMFVLSTGCRNKSGPVEAELRTKEILYRHSLEDLERSEARIMAMEQELDALRKGAKITPEQAASTFGIKRITLGRGTSGYDNDGLPGDELLQVCVEPHDIDDHVIKAPGSLQIFTLEISPQGIKTPLCMWDISPDQLRNSWKQGLLSNGYTLQLPWKQFPAYEQVRVVVRFITPDKRVYEADKDIRVRLVPGVPHRAPEPMMEGPMPSPLPDSGPPLLPTHTTQWRPLDAERPVSIGRPTPIP